MITNELMIFLKDKKIWFDDESEDYKKSLLSLNISENSDIGYFYLHAEQNPNFISKNGELLQICWHAINTNYISNTENLKKALDIPSSGIILSSFESGSGWFYDNATGKVHLKTPTNENTQETIEWDNFGNFLSYFFLN
ncbi:hypothetical protein [Delftia acidovorans]|uniref:hypothetical protein n=1 Tax=Delftia acidovorans TaxID=80866 RepID=UPI003D0E5D2E